MSDKKRIKQIEIMPTERNDGSKYYLAALDIVGALGDAGFCLLPMVPTPLMQRAGAAAARIAPDTADHTYRAVAQTAAGECGDNSHDPFALFDYLLRNGKPH